MKNKKRVVKFKPFAQLKTGVRSVSINTYKDSKGKDIFTSTFYSPSDNAFVTVKSKDVNSTVKAVKHIYFKKSGCKDREKIKGVSAMEESKGITKKEFLEHLSCCFNNTEAFGYLFKAVKGLTHGDLKLKGKMLTQEQFEDLRNAFSWALEELTEEEAEQYYYDSSLNIKYLK